MCQFEYRILAGFLGITGHLCEPTYGTPSERAL
jgi:hypothetical protein